MYYEFYTTSASRLLVTNQFELKETIVGPLAIT